MADTAEHAARTRTAARVIGPLMLIIGAIVAARYEALMLMIPAMLGDAPLMFIAGVFTLIVGLILFAWHHHWSSAAAIAVSLIGVLTILRGVLLMSAPEIAAGLASHAMQSGLGAVIAAVIALLLGAWLSFVGWFAKAAP